MKPDETQIRSVVHSVWSTQLGITIQDAEESTAGTGSPRMTAAIHISGDFSGGIRVDCSKVLVRRAAAIMFGKEANQLDEDDDRDVIGELTNVIAGNIKALIPGTNIISLPTIVEGSDYRVSSLDVETCDDFHFSFEGEPLTVTFLELRGSSNPTDQTGDPKD